MKMKVLVTVELHDADDSQRRVFSAEMRKRRWARYPASPSAYCLELSGLDSDSDAVSLSEEDVTCAAEKARVYRWDGVCLLSDDAAAAC